MTVLDLPLETYKLPRSCNHQKAFFTAFHSNTFFSYTVIIVSRQGHAFVDVDARKRMMPKMTSSYGLVRLIGDAIFSFHMQKWHGSATCLSQNLQHLSHPFV
jgi:hypothetical protein